jgi:hypothetical protein
MLVGVREGVRMVDNRWHTVVRLGASETPRVPCAASKSVYEAQ